MEYLSISSYAFDAVTVLGFYSATKRHISMIKVFNITRMLLRVGLFQRGIQTV